MAFADFLDDCYRYTGRKVVPVGLLLRDHSLRYLLCLRGGAFDAVAKAHADEVRP